MKPAMQHALRAALVALALPALLLIQSTAYALPPPCDPAVDPPTTQIITISSPANNTVFAAGTTPITVTFTESGTRSYNGATWTLYSSAAATQTGSLGSTVYSVSFANLGAANYSVVVAPKIGIIGDGCEVDQTNGTVAFSVAPSTTPQTITGFAPATPISYSPGGTFALTATGGGSGNPVTFASTTTSVCTVSGTTATIVAVGTCTLTANVVINKAGQTISFGALATRNYGDAPFTVAATASSGLGVTFSSTTPTICSVSGSTVTLIAAGTCTIAADQAGNSNYNAAAQVAQSFTVNKAAQTITFGALTSKAYGSAPFTVAATSSSSLAVSFSSTTTAVCTVAGTTVTIAAVGTCSIAADQAGNANYNVATQVVQSFAVTQAGQTITGFAPATPINYSPGGTFALAATGGASGNPVTFASTTASFCTVSGTTATIIAVGTCTLTANQVGNANYAAAAQVTASVVINKANQTITFGTLTTRTVGDAPFAVSATASSGLAVTFSSTTGTVCTVSGSTVSLLTAGTCTIAADQAGNANYNAAPQVSQSFTVNAPPIQVFYVHPDHLGTPRAITRASDNAKVWEWRNDDPFGNNPPNENPSGLGQFPYNNRFPGQYYDQETGTSHNWFRTYNPALGKYEQSDPIGLKGGISTYGYVRGNPLGLTDWYGLAVDLQVMADWLNKNAYLKSHGQCANHVRRGLEAGGGISGYPNTNPVSAKDWGPTLVDNGFEVASPSGYMPQLGDTVIFQPTPGHNDGHIETYNGTRWVSDYSQNNFVPPAYKGAPFTIYRQPPIPSPPSPSPTSVDTPSPSPVESCGCG